jgi:hypothetical protein
MTKRISLFAIMACLASSLVFAGDQATTRSSADGAKAKAAQSALRGEAQADTNSSGDTVKDKNKDKKKDKRNAKPAPSDQEREFDRVLMGIYG